MKLERSVLCTSSVKFVQNAARTHDLAISAKLEVVGDDLFREPPQRVVVDVARLDLAEVPRDDERTGRGDNGPFGFAAQTGVEPANTPRRAWSTARHPARRKSSRERTWQA